MFDLRIELGTSTTHVAVRAGMIRDVGDLLATATGAPSDTRVLCVTDERVAGLYGAGVRESLERAGFTSSTHAIRPGEASKSLEGLEALYGALSASALDRDGIVLALGGGVVSDLAGLAAATWMRGIRFAICPTTLEAAIDASIGGKTAINLPSGKNLVGAFHQPTLVAIDPDCLASLEPRDIRAGMAESIKHALITSETFTAWHEANAEAILSLDSDVVSELILRNVRIKAEVVRADAHERTGRRIMLNFGHTVGHAIETCCRFTLRHGECVALGMLAAGRLSQQIGLLDAATVERVERLVRRFGLATRLSEPIPMDALLAAMQHDKKARHGRLRFVLLSGIGNPVVHDDITEQQVRQACSGILE